MKRVLAVLVALAVLAAPCALVNSGPTLASSGQAGQHHALGHEQDPAGLQGDCPGDSGEVAHVCPAKCHSWNVTALAILTPPPRTSDDGGHSAGLAAIGVVSPAASRPLGDRPASHLQVQGRSAPVYRLTQRYRI